MKRRINIMAATVRTTFAALVICAIFISACAKSVAKSGENLKPASYLEANSKLPKADVAVLPLFIKAPAVYSFDVDLRRGFDRIATALNESFSTAVMPLPGAIDEIYSKQTFEINGKAIDPDLLKKFCAELNVSTLYFGTMSFKENGLDLVVQNFDCTAVKEGATKESFHADGLSWEGMEHLESQGELAINAAVLKTYPGKYGSVQDGPELSKSDEAKLKKAFDFLDQNDPFSLIQGIAAFSEAISQNPRDPRAWSGLAECWVGLGWISPGQQNCGAVEYGAVFQPPAFAASRVSMLLDQKDFYANRAAALVDHQILRDARATDEIKKALDINPEDIRAQALNGAIYASSHGYNVHKTHPENIFAQSLNLFGFDMDTFKKVAAQQPSLQPVLTTHMLQLTWNYGCRQSHSNPQEEQRAGLTVLYASNLLAERSAKLFKADWKNQKWSMTPDLKAPEFAGILGDTDPGLKKLVDNRKLSTIGDSTRESHNATRELQNLVLQDPSRLRNHPLSSLNADPLLLSKYLDRMSLEGLFLVELESSFQGNREEEEVLLPIMLDLYYYSPEAISLVLQRYAQHPEWAKAKALLDQYGNDYMDDPLMMFAITVYANNLEQGTLPMNYIERIPFRWPIYAYAITEVAAFSKNLPGDLCERSVQAAMASNPKDVNAQTIKIQCLEWVGDFAGAMEEIKRINQDTHSNLGDYEKVKLNNMMGNFDANLKLLDTPYKANQISIINMFTEDLKQSYLGKGDAEGAAQMLDASASSGQILRLPSVNRLVEAGNIYGYLGKGEKAMEYYKRAAEIEPAMESVMVGLAKGYAMLGQYNLSDQEFELALKRYQDSNWTKRKWAWTLMQRGELSRAEELLVNTFKSEPSMDQLLYLWHLRVMQDRNQDLSSIFAGPIDHDMQAEILYQIGMFDLIERNVPREAQKVAEEMRKNFADNAHTGMLAAQVALAQGDYASAEKISRGLSGNKSFSPMTMDYVLLKSLARQKKTEKANLKLVELQKKQIDTPFLNLARAELALASGNVDAARVALQNLAPLSFNISMPWEYEPYMKIYVAECYLDFIKISGSQNDIALAQTAFKRLGESLEFPWNMYPWLWQYYQGVVEEKAGNSVDAKAHYQQALKTAPGFNRAKAKLAAAKGSKQE